MTRKRKMEIRLHGVPVIKVLSYCLSGPSPPFFTLSVMLHWGLCKLHLACWLLLYWAPQTGPIGDKRLTEKKGIYSFSSVSEDILAVPLNQCFFTLVASVPSYNTI